jgi:hypothetical protein
VVHAHLLKRRYCNRSDAIRRIRLRGKARDRVIHYRLDHWLNGRLDKWEHRLREKQDRVNFIGRGFWAFCDNT